MRSKKAIINIFFSLILELFTIASGFIIPHFIINSFGSNINGLVSSITQFLGYLVLLQSGVGGVIKASLYKPLAEDNNDEISSIINTTDLFFKKIGKITIVYIIILAIIFSLFLNNDTNLMSIETFVLVLIIGFGVIGQYYVGITYQVLLEASQKGYIYSIIQIITIVVNTILCVICIECGCSIFIVKLISSFIFFIKPFCLKYYVTKKFNLNKKVKPNKDKISQRWDGVGHTIAYFVHNKTDIIVLTLLSSFNEVSVYTIYNMITTGLNTIISRISTPVQSAFGDMIARDESDNLKKNFSRYMNIVFILCSVLFSAAIVLTIPFVKIYTQKFDFNYIRPQFAVIILMAELIYCLRLPFHSIIISAGHYKQTKKGAFIEAGINIVLSVLLVSKYGLIGVGIGTLLAMIYRTIDYVIYLKDNLLNLDVKSIFIKIVSITLLVFFNGIIISRISITIDNYISWIVYAIITVLVSGCLTVAFYIAFYRRDFLDILNYSIRFIKGLNKKKA